MKYASNHKSFFGVILCAALLAFTIPVSSARAETRVPINNFIDHDTIWDKTGSPYILEDYVTVNPGVTLTVKDGVEIAGDPANVFTGIVTNGGVIDIQGKGSARVIIRDLMTVGAINGSFSSKNADFRQVNNITLDGSSGIIATSTVSGGYDGFVMKNSVVSIQGSKFTNSRRGITVQASGNPQLVANETPLDIGGIGNALDQSQAVPSLTVVNSSLAGNSSYALRNYSTGTVIAENNWWGSAEGPVTDITKYGNVVVGAVDYDPWLMSEPPLDPGQDKPECCSSVLFLPGLEGTAIYRPESLPLELGPITNTLWPPNRNDDVRKLFLNPDGTNPDPAIYSGDPIASVFGLYRIYGKFMDFLDGLVRNGTVNEWKSFGYDWRKPIAEVVAGPEQKATTTEYLVKDVEDLAARSRTGKVTLIAHSNGGLVAKYLVKTLSDLGKAGLIDSVISVAVPYLGTPQAIASILHGDGESILSGIILKKSVARQLGQNMPSAYSLLPSAAYFSNVLGPTIAFASTTVAGVNDGSYQQNIRSGAEQSRFITDSNNIRVDPRPSNTDMPIKGNSVLMAAADTLHAFIDTFTWPAAITRWAILGWGLNTTKEVKYADAPMVSKDMSSMGDGTVMAKSAAYDAGNAMSIDLESASRADKNSTDHATILESSTTQQLIGNALTKQEYQSVCDAVTKLPGVTCGEPDYSKDVAPVNIVISTHSPVDLHVYDENGNHTGTISRPPEVEDDILTFYETQIPGSYFSLDEKGDDDIDQYVTLPDTGKKYTVAVKGTGSGTFTLDIDRTIGGDLNTIDRVEYVGQPVIPLTAASTTIEIPPLGENPATTTGLIVSAARPLEIDVDGDGAVDLEAKPNQKLTAIDYLNSLRSLITNMLGDSKKAKELFKRIDKIEKESTKSAKNERSGNEKGGEKDDKKAGKITEKIIKAADKFKANIGHKKFKELTQADKDKIISQIDLFISQFEQ
ncbi:hypothetical protein KGQ27_02305 [Patescibacteria group bacterium]|nr:hypothetical protein [Patescibacteria group bacterium]MDE1946398.1 hypothetical protein [Patescibacteria group bacterium]MDE2011007.1 hypothetical protein [Patescibacteria group bacterium]MDE2233030.1 hypothetical protein [Patescibacteria group bacterium]